MDVTLIVATYGSKEWYAMGQDALDLSLPDDGTVGIHIHESDGTLASARNHALDMVGTEFVCFLDADDSLEPGYFDAMAQGTADLRAPSVRYVRAGAGHTTAYVPYVEVNGERLQTAEALMHGNWMVIGTVARTAIVKGAGGFKEWDFYEDWDLWQRCYLRGATVEAIPKAVYRATYRSNSRNRSPSRAARRAMHEAIRQANAPKDGG